MSREIEMKGATKMAERITRILNDLIKELDEVSLYRIDD